MCSCRRKEFVRSNPPQHRPPYVQYQDSLGGMASLYIWYWTYRMDFVRSYSILHIAREPDWSFGFCTVGNLPSCITVVQHAPWVFQRNYEYENSVACPCCYICAGNFHLDSRNIVSLISVLIQCLSS